LNGASTWELAPYTLGEGPNRCRKENQADESRRYCSIGRNRRRHPTRFHAEDQTTAPDKSPLFARHALSSADNPFRNTPGRCSCPMSEHNKPSLRIHVRRESC